MNYDTRHKTARPGTVRADCGDGYDVLYLEQVECDHPVQVRDWAGTRAPMHTVPSGLVFTSMGRRTRSMDSQGRNSGWGRSARAFFM